MIRSYVLGAVFLQLCKTLRLNEHPIVQKPVDPSWFIHKFTESKCENSVITNSFLTLGFGFKCNLFRVIASLLSNKRSLPLSSVETVSAEWLYGRICIQLILQKYQIQQSVFSFAFLV